MAKTGDVEFTIGVTPYNFMVKADERGRKAWNVRQLARTAPSMARQKIDMVIVAAADMRQADGTAIATRTISTVLAELRTLSDVTTINGVALVGYDGASYFVLFDIDATSVTSRTDESGRMTEYDIALSLWGFYTKAE